MFGLGKARSAYGKFLDEHGIKQERIREETKLNKDTLTKACNDSEYLPSGATMKKLLEAARKLTGGNVKQDDFWPM